MMADTPSSVSALHDAITAFRKQCGDDDDCERILTLADACETEIERAYPDEEKREKSGDPDEPEDVPREKQPKTLQGARADVRARMASRRNQ